MLDNAKRRKALFNTVFSALFLALAYLIPLLTGQVQSINAMFCPMHIPIFLCGAICGWQWGLAVGIIAPISRSLILGMPLFFPTAVCMAFELAAYGAIAGLMHKLLPKKKPYIYCSLVVAMIVGRLVWGLASYLFVVGVKGGSFTLAAFFAGAVTNALPGIILQIILVPVLVMAAERFKFLNFED